MSTEEAPEPRWESREAEEIGLPPLLHTDALDGAAMDRVHSLLHEAASIVAASLGEAQGLAPDTEARRILDRWERHRSTHGDPMDVVAAYARRLEAQVAEQAATIKAIGEQAVDVGREAGTLRARIAAARTHIERLEAIGHEPWKTPGHPMNQWVGRDTVNSGARRALDALDGVTP